MSGVKRTPREWSEKCSQCGGHGTVHRREHFQLWTPEEYEERMGEPRRPLADKYDVPADAYVCEAVGGASIFEACQEGVAIARMVQRTVVFEFNETLAICKPDGDPEAIAKAWWVRAYDRTYEESMRLR